jgi:predicted ATPase/class 3 adenylate cyclase
MFCDLVGSTALSAQLDPEEWREVVCAYQATCGQVIQRYEGRIAQYLGDGLLVYFGYPSAHEDDAQRAARAGLGILAVLHELNARRHHPVQVRIGIHTGLVVVGEIGEDGKGEQLALGDTPNIAARLQGLAEPDTVVISMSTYRLIAGLLDCRDLGLHAVKGVSTPLQVYQVVGESGIRSRLDVAVAAGLAPLVGREEEVRLLLRRWDQAKTGEGQGILLSGEAGIGKSRLGQELKEQVAREQGMQIEFRCSPYYQNTAFYPVIEHLQRVLQFTREDVDEQRLLKLERTLTAAGLSLPEVVPLVAPLLSLSLPVHYPALSLTPQRQRQKTLEVLLAWLLKEGEQHPVLLVVEDLHWVDPSTLEFLSLLIDQVPTAHVLVLLTFRPDFRPPWAMLSHLTQLTLSRLGRKQVEQIVEKVASGKALPPEVVQQVVSKTDGVPLFVEELTKMVLESGWLREADGHYELIGSLPPLAIPATLQDSLVARLDRLATVKEVAQMGATLGREFSYELCQAVSPVDETRLQQALAKLVEAEVLYQRGQPPHARYVFKHALIQDAAYQSLLKNTRQQFHHRIAQTLVARFPETVEAEPELVAHHYTEAGLIEQAIPYWQQAGQRAFERSAYIEAIAHFTQGLKHLRSLPETTERLQQELSLQTTLGPVFMAAKGYAAPEVGAVYDRARELCQQLGEIPQLFPVLFGLWVFYTVRAEHEMARELAEQLFPLAQSLQDSALLLEAHHALGQTLFFLGEVAPARAHIEQGIALYDPHQHHALTFLYGSGDPGVFCRGFAAYTLWLLGYPDQALKRSHEALALAQELSHPHSLVSTLNHGAMLHHFRREVQPIHERVERLMGLSQEQGFPFWLAMGLIWQGWVLAEHGRGEEGILQMRQGLAAVRATGARQGGAYALTMLAEAYGKVGRAGKGLALLVEALSLLERTGERFWEAELYRLKGELTLQQLQVSGSALQVDTLRAEAEEWFWKAIEIARRQKGKSLELRAVASLSRLWQQQGRKEDARQMLAEIYNWFTEGFDTKDLQEAKALLEELT